MNTFFSKLLRLVQKLFANLFIRLGLCVFGGMLVSRALHGLPLWLILLVAVGLGASIALINIFLTNRVKRQDRETYLRGGFSAEERAQRDAKLPEDGGGIDW